MNLATCNVGIRLKCICSVPENDDVRWTAFYYQSETNYTFDSPPPPHRSVFSKPHIHLLSLAALCVSSHIHILTVSYFPYLSSKPPQPHSSLAAISLSNLKLLYGSLQSPPADFFLFSLSQNQSITPNCSITLVKKAKEEERGRGEDVLSAWIAQSALVNRHRLE